MFIAVGVHAPEKGRFVALFSQRNDSEKRIHVLITCEHTSINARNLGWFLAALEK
jgi:hypothetical protein